MPARNRAKATGRKEGGSFVMLPHAVLNHPNFTSLSPNGLKLLIDLYAQYKGDNNGDLCATWSLMKKRGWNSPVTLDKAKKELLRFEWIVISRKGGRNSADLCAVTFQAIDECEGKLDISATPQALGYWKHDKPQFIAKA